MKKKELIEKLNNKLMESIEKKPEWVVQVLKDVKLPKGRELSEMKNPVPNLEIGQKLIGLLSEKEEDATLGKDVISICLNLWHEEYADPLIQKCTNIVSYYNQQRITELNSTMHIVLRVIEDMPAWVSEEKAPSLADQLWGMYAKMQSPEDKVEIMKTYMITVCSISPAGSYETNIIGQVAAYLMPQFELVIKFINKYKKKDNWWSDIEKKIVGGAIDRVTNNPIEENLAKFNFIHSKRRNLIDVDKLKQLLSKIILQCADGILKTWKSKISEMALENDSIRDFIVDNLRKAVDDTTYNLQIERRKYSLSVLLDIVDRLNDKNLNVQIGEWMLSFTDVAHLRPIIHDYITNIRNLLGAKVRTYISARVKDLLAKDLQQILNQSYTVDVYLQFQSSWDADARKQFTDVLVRAIQSRNQSYYNFAYDVLIRKPKLSKRKTKDLIHAIEGLVINVPQEEKRWRKIIEEAK